MKELCPLNKKTLPYPAIILYIISSASFIQLSQEVLFMKSPRFLFRIMPLLLLAVGLSAQTQQPRSPENYFGFPIGSDRKLIGWNEIVEYFNYLDNNSPRVQVRELGKTTQGRPFLVSIFSSPQNLEHLSRYQEIQKELANPYTLPQQEAERLAEEGKAVILLSFNIHSTEIASSQESVELAWELATAENERIKKILDNVIILMIPSMNPDGQQMVTDWYRKWVGTPYEGCSLPWIYHYYAGHDNNRDLFMFNLVESRYAARVLYQEWFPEIVYDQHQMGSSGPRLFLPPYSDPINLNVPTELMASVNMAGQHMISDMYKQGFTGVTSDMGFNAYFEGTMSKTPLWHNMVGILSEMASARIATPIFLPRGSLGDWGPERARYSNRTEHLKPWPGGWWRLRNIIDYEKAASYSILDLAATYKKKFMLDFYSLNRKSIQRGRTDPPFAYLIPPDQRDPGSAEEMLKRLRFNGIKIYRIQEALTQNGITYPAGSVIIPLAQPCRPCIKDLFEYQKYPDLKAYPGGPPLRPYDFAGWSLPLQMGVRFVEMDQPITVNLAETDDFSFTHPQALRQAAAYFFSRSNNNSYGLVNDLIKRGVPVSWFDQDFSTEKGRIKQGTFLVRGDGNKREILSDLSRKWEVKIESGDFPEKAALSSLNRLRIGIYQPWTASIDEGWTRLVLDMYGFGYKVLHNEDIKKGRLTNLDAVILPSLGVTSLINGRSAGSRPGSPATPPVYQGGIGKEGSDALQKFVRNGGTLVAIGGSCGFAWKELRLPVRDVLENVDSKRFFVPGSLLKISLDTTDPLAFGMPEETAIRFYNHPVMRLLPYDRESRAVGFYKDENPLLSGWLIGPELLAGHTALAAVPLQNGRVVLFGFGVQSRAQTFGTFKLLFNALLTSAVVKE